MIQIDKTNSKTQLVYADYLEMERLLNKVLESQFFYENCKNSTFTNTVMIGSEIAQKMREDAKVALIRYKNPWFKRFSKVVGYVNGAVSGNKTGYIYVNSKYFDVNDIYGRCSNILHETSHLKGFRHSSATDYNSVPYQMNRIFLKTCENLGVKK